MASAVPLGDLRAAVQQMGSKVMLSSFAPGMGSLAQRWSNILLTYGIHVNQATVSGSDGSAGFQIAGMSDLFDMPAPIAITVYQPVDAIGAGQPECLVVWTKPFLNWSPGVAYLNPPNSARPDRPFQALLRTVCLQDVSMLYSSADLKARPAAAAGCGALPSWLNGRKPREGLSARGTLRLPENLARLLEKLIGPIGSVVVDCHVGLSLNAPQLILSHDIEGDSRPSFAPFGDKGPSAALSRLCLSFPMGEWASASPSAELDFVLRDGDFEIGLSVTIDLLSEAATVVLNAAPGRSPSLAWFANQVGIAIPDLPFELGSLTLARVSGTFDLARRKLDAFEATIAGSKPVSLLDGHVGLTPELIITYSPATTPSLDVILFGVWQSGGSALNTIIDPGSGTVVVALQEGSTVDVGHLLPAGLLPNWLTTDLVILDFDLTGNVTTGVFTVELETDGAINLSIEGQTVGIADVDIVAQYANKSFAVTARGTLDICGYLVPVALGAGPSATISFALPRLDLADLAEVFLKKVGEPADLGSFALQSVAVMLSHPGGQFSVSGGIVDHMPIGGSDAWGLESATFAASRDARGLRASITGRIALAGQPIDLAGQYLGSGAGWLLTGSTPKSQPVGLGALVGELAQKLGAPVPTELVAAIGAIQVDRIDVAVNTGDKSFQLLANVTSKGRLPFGANSELDLKAYVSSTVDAAGKRSFAGHLEADLTIGKAAFVVAFDFGPAANVFRASWRDTVGSTLSFHEIAGLLGIPHDIQVPAELDFGLKAAAFEYRSATSSFLLSAESTKFGDAFFTAGKDQGGRLGFVFGVDLPHDIRLSSLPGIGKDLKAADFLSVKQGAVLLSSGNFPAYQLPQLPALPAPTAATSRWTARPLGRSVKPVATGATLQLTPGLSLATIVDFAATKDVRAQNLRSIARSDQLMLQTSIGAGGLKLAGGLSGGATIQSGKTRLTLTQPMVRIDIGPVVTFQMSGGVAFKVNGTTVVATARMMINELEAQVALEISGDQKPLPPPPGLKGLHIEKFGVVMGVYFAPAGVDVGLAGSFTIGNVKNAKGNSFGIVLEVLEDGANVLYLAFNVDQLDLGTALSLFTDRSDQALVQTLNVIKASDLAFHWCDSVVTLPDGSLVLPGFGFSASLNVFGFGAHADLEIGVTDGIHGQAQMAPFNLRDVLKASGSGKGLIRTYEQVNGNWQQVDNAAVKRSLQAPPRRTQTIVVPGGPVFQFNCRQSPFVQCGMDVTLFEAHAAVSANVDRSGFAFKLDFDCGNIDRFTLACTLRDKNHFEASADIAMALKASIGPIHVNGMNMGQLNLDTRFGGHLAIALEPSRFNLALAGSFRIQGLTFNPPQLTLDVAPARLAELPKKLIELIGQGADDIFKQLFADGDRWAAMVKSGVVTGAGDVAGTLKSAYHMSEAQAQQAMQKAGYVAGDVERAIRGAFGTVASTGQDLGNKIADGAKDAGNKVADGAKDAGNKVVDGAKDVGNTISGWFH